MIDIFEKYLRKFVMVFFNDILNVESWMEHIQHLQIVFATLQQHLLFLTKSKCIFDQSNVILSSQ